ncbi:hypothetical protein LENED_007911 [Lentinula edodes]|uniref:Uncharacterized protein n=1 Tax=Lentinula edodes TaxID=5353 RepID=A0A1Q3EFS8_LENED|nr:hypothetical protein LENED_007911 [Lentinula edodes]
MTSTYIQHLLGRKLSSPPVVAYLNELSSAVELSAASTPEIKSYPDVIYYNFHTLGLSLLFKPIEGYKPKIDPYVRFKKEERDRHSMTLYTVPADRAIEGEFQACGSTITLPWHQVFWELSKNIHSFIHKK